MNFISSCNKTFNSIVLIWVCLVLSDISLSSQNSPYIITDQFGYRPESTKIAVIRDPHIGYDASEIYNPGSTFSVVKSADGTDVYLGNIKAWNNNSTDPISGDKVWHFDFSSLTEPGEYYILDKTTQQKSFNFKVHEDIYTEVLKTAVKSFYYQRSGFEKKAIFASNWADGASHIGNLQDKNCRPYNAKTDASKTKDLSGGWYDAGDYNKYTPWTASYIVTLLQAYEESPHIWTDDYHIPESGNGIPDLIDEVLFGLDWLKKMQNADGSCLSIVGCAHGTPPSVAVGQSVYGPASTFATLKCAGAFAYASLVLRKFPQFQTLADDFTLRSESAWKWANDHPNVLFPNNSSSNGSQGVGAGNQETDDLGRMTAKLGAALFLYRATGKTSYKTYFESQHMEMPLFKWGTYISQYFFESQDLLFQYTLLPDHTPTIAASIKSTTLAAAKKSGDFADAILKGTDPYFSFIKDYNWGSNQYKSIYGNVFYIMSSLNIEPANSKKYIDAAESYLHYIHGVNPFGMVYLSNMKSIGADKGITQFYHSWFAEGSKWDQEGVSLYGPAPGFLAGGPNTSYSVDGCCPNNCGSAQNNAICTSQVLTPPLNQPAMKAYKDFNNSWPLNSWAISENSNGYQVSYIRLLSKFVSSGNNVGSTEHASTRQKFAVYPNPTNGIVTIKVNDANIYNLLIQNMSGHTIINDKISSTANINLEHYPSGIYIISLSDGRNEWREKVVR